MEVARGEPNRTATPAWILPNDTGPGLDAGAPPESQCAAGATGRHRIWSALGLVVAGPLRGPQEPGVATRGPDALPSRRSPSRPQPASRQRPAASPRQIPERRHRGVMASAPRHPSSADPADPSEVRACAHAAGVRPIPIDISPRGMSRDASSVNLGLPMLRHGVLDRRTVTGAEAGDWYVVTGMLNGVVLPPGLTPIVTGAWWLLCNRFVDRAGEHLVLGPVATLTEEDWGRCRLLVGPAPDRVHQGLRGQPAAGVGPAQLRLRAPALAQSAGRRGHPSRGLFSTLAEATVPGGCVAAARSLPSDPIDRGRLRSERSVVPVSVR